VTSDWKLIGSGFAIAGLGAGATMLYIVGVSGVYIGRYAAGAGALAAASLLALAFHRLLGRYLDTLDSRAGDAGGDEDKDQDVATEAEQP
jgi:hypothetical protein